MPVWSKSANPFPLCLFTYDAAIPIFRQLIDETMRNIKIQYLLPALMLSLLLFSCNRQEVKSLPNIILLISDDQSWPHYSFMGHEHIQSPRIDQLAAEGLTITHGYTTAPLCRPALASMATGLYPHQHGALGNDPLFDRGKKEAYRKEWMLQRAEINEPYVAGIEQISTLADLLGAAGYVSLQTGKWWEGHYSQGGFSQGMTHGDPSRGGRHGDEGLKIGREGLEIIYDFIDDAKDTETPFFVWYAPFLPHAPHTPPDSLRDKYLALAPTPAVANYWAMCEWFDITCGQLMDYVDQQGMSENTLFVYVTDNGWIQDPDRPNRYAPRSKREPYDMGIRTPIIYRWKGVIDPELDEQARNERQAIFAEVGAHDFSTLDSSLYHRIVVTKPWKLILPDPFGQPGREPELYNLDNDPYEWDNLAKKHPEIVASLSGQIEEWWAKN
jgi:arylsulfatase A-like enzyme